MKTLRLRVLKALALAVSTLLAAASFSVGLAQTGKRQAAKPSTVLFVVSGESEQGPSSDYQMDALAVIDKGRYVDPVGDGTNGAMKPFAERYFKAGSKYRVVFGGGEIGTATVRSSQEGCNTIHSTVGFEGANKIRGQIKGLATNSDALGNQPSSRRALTAAERNSVMTLARNIYRQHKTSNAQLRTLKANNLTATDLDGDGKFEVVGNFQIAYGPNSPYRRDLFLIATPGGTGYRAELAEFQSYRMTDGFGRGIAFVDQLDMDGDGISEVVTINEGYDGYGYSIYQRKGGVWRSIYSVMGDAC